MSYIKLLGVCIIAACLSGQGSFAAEMGVIDKGNGNIGELKIGAGGKINSRLNLRSNIEGQVGGRGYYDMSAILGLKYTF